MMISFVWPSREPMLAGTGGSETFTAGHVRELLRRGIDAQVVIVGPAVRASRADFPDVPFLGIRDPEEISKISGTVVFVNHAYDVPTKRKAAIILHNVIPPVSEKPARQADIANKTVMATSIYSAQQWALYLGIPYSRINVILPFADPIFGNIKRSKTTKKIRILYAGRLHPEKGIYTILEMMHNPAMRAINATVSIVMAGQAVEEGKVIAHMLDRYPYAKLLPPMKTVSSMAKLLAYTDILLVPSVFAEPFGMLSIEAQHAGCRVIASNLGGLPETNCGLLTLVKQRDPPALINSINEAIALGPSSTRDRIKATHRFTLNDSVTELLKALHL
ncbi:MAG: glycosyltransferase [Candidatus Saccharimonadales bacterium]